MRVAHHSGDGGIPRGDEAILLCISALPFLDEQARESRQRLRAEPGAIDERALR